MKAVNVISAVSPGPNIPSFGETCNQFWQISLSFSLGTNFQRMIDCPVFDSVTLLEWDTPNLRFLKLTSVWLGMVRTDEIKAYVREV